MLDGVDSPGEYAGSLIDIGRIWEGGGNCPAAGFGTDCGTSGAVGGPTSTYARAAWRDDALYFYIRVRDEFQSYAVKPAECVAPLAGGLGRDPDRPARPRVRQRDGHGQHVQARDLPVHERPDQLQRQRRQRPVLGA